MRHNARRVAPRPNKPLDCTEMPRAIWHDHALAIRAGMRLRRKLPLGGSTQPDRVVLSAAPLLVDVLETLLEVA